MRTFLMVFVFGFLAAPLVHADDAPRKSWYQRWFGKNQKKAHEPAKEDVERPLPDLTKDRAEAEAAYHRRVAVCDKLRGIALATGDDDLNRKADQLTQATWKSYLKRTAHLPTSNFRSDEQIFESNLGLTRGQASAAGPSGPSGNAARAAVKEN